MSTAVNPTPTSVPASSRPSSIPTNHTHADSSYTNGHHHHHHDVGGYQQSAANAKKGKQKKTTDPNEASKLIAAKISQLELGAAEDKEQEAEIEREVKRANRELNSLTSKMDDLQKIEVLQKRVTEHLTDVKRWERKSRKNQKRADDLQKEKDTRTQELSKQTSMKAKLEQLCRELQKENNKLKAENRAYQDSEKSSHDSWDEKFKSLLWQLQDYQDAKDHPQTQIVNIEVEELFKQRFKSLIDQYELRELHFHSLMRTKELEVQYNMARFDRERKAAEAEVHKSKALNTQVLTFSKTENELRNQLNIYVEKFKQEMEDMSKKTKRLEKENMNLTRKHDLTNQNILKMAQERTKNTEVMDALRKKNEKLTSIINQMQKQGRGVAGGAMGLPDGAVEDEYVEGDMDATESDYEYEDEEAEDGDEEGSEEGEYDEDTEEELHLQGGPKPFGPVPPPAPLSAANGIMAAVNDNKH
ncbi:putative alpha-taxilin [Amylocarpus encephaloides]|uniref:Alpha-taxilin n=1 Tax=Amylocarpus encephaloides TaxID=45428 RepID=A0A9P7YTX9_9HELO|nr:putative alpha-taxilin [Amylocarpus encephaloides]